MNRVLLVDDDPLILKLFRDGLARHDFQVETASDGLEAMKMLRAARPDIVILDLMMPNLSGLDLLAQIRAADDDIAVIILTGHPSLDSATASIQHEVSAYIHKPFTPAEFRD
ncbi:MAG TPA: response regulator, partial [Verrucomicrobiae bacterium]|nr:response regulator [Verrucomicrobiae bacterium]